MTSIINNFLIKQIYPGAFNSSKLKIARENHKSLLAFNGVERKTLTLSSGNKIDGFYFDAKKLRNHLQDEYFFNRECFKVTEKLPSIGDETVLLIFGNRALCELKCNNLISVYLNYGFNVRVYNQPGYGESLTPDGNLPALQPEPVYEAARLVYQDLREQLGGNARILVHGISLGSCSAAEIASKFSKENMVCILDRPICRMSTAIEDACSKLYPKAGFLLKKIVASSIEFFEQEFRNDEKISTFYGKEIVLLSAEQDEIFSIEQVKGLAKNLPKLSFDDIVVSMPAGHGGSVPDWSESSNPLCKERFNELLRKLGYSIT